MNKKLIIILLALLILSPLFVHTVAAQASSSSSGPIKTVLDLFVNNFGFLFEKGFLQGANAVVYLKMMFGLIIVLPLFMIVKGISKNKGVAVAISLAIGIISMVAIPDKIILNLVNVYGSVSTLILYALPLGSIYFLYRYGESLAKNAGGPYKAAIYIVELVMLIFAMRYSINFEYAVSEAVQGQGLDLLMQHAQRITGWIQLIVGFAILGVVWKILGTFGGGKRAQSWVKGKTTDKIFGRGSSEGEGKGIPGLGKDSGSDDGPSSKDTADLTRIVGDVTRLETEIRVHIKDIRAVSSKTGADLSDIRTAFENLSHTFMKTGKVYKNWQAYSSSGVRNVAVEQDLNNKWQVLSTEINDIWTDLQNKLSNLQGVTDQETKLVASNNALKDNLTKDITSMNALISSLDKKAIDQTSKIATLKTRYAGDAAVMGELASHEAALVTLENNLVDLDQHVINIKTLLDNFINSNNIAMSLLVNVKDILNSITLKVNNVNNDVQTSPSEASFVKAANTVDTIASSDTANIQTKETQIQDVLDKLDNLMKATDKAIADAQNQLTTIENEIKIIEAYTATK